MMTNEERDDHIRQIWEVVRESQLTLARIATLCPQCQEEIKNHRMAIEGNGVKGLRTRMESAELRITWIWGVLTAAWAALAAVGTIVLERILGKSAGG